MATRGDVSSPPSNSSFSPNGNSFSIKNILNLSDETTEKQKWISKVGVPFDALDAPCSAPSLLVAPRAVFPPVYYRPHLSSCLPGIWHNIGPLPSPQPVVQITPFTFPGHVGSFGEFTNLANVHSVTHCTFFLSAFNSVELQCVNYLKSRPNEILCLIDLV